VRQFIAKLGSTDKNPTEYFVVQRISLQGKKILDITLEFTPFYRLHSPRRGWLLIERTIENLLRSVGAAFCTVSLGGSCGAQKSTLVRAIKRQPLRGEM